MYGDDVGGTGKMEFPGGQFKDYCGIRFKKV